MKFGFDFHGVLNTHGKEYAELTAALVEAGHEVHIVTGLQETQELKDELASYGIAWTRWFSIVDYHLELGEYEITWDDNQEPWMDAEAWNRSKADYCAREGLDFHLDDSPNYGSYFVGKTVFLLQKNPERQAAWMRLAGRI